MSVAKNKRFIAIIAIMTMLAMVVTGCGGTDDDGADTGDTGGDVVEVKIGVSSPFTGDVAALGTGIRNGAQLAVEEAAEEMADLGINLTMLAVDDAADPRTGVNAANQMVSDSAVVGVVAHLNSGVSIPASEVYNQAGIVQISPASTNPALTLQGLDTVFRVCTIDTVQGSFAAEYAYDELELASVAVIDDSTAYGEGHAAEFAAAFEAKGGEIVSTDKIQVKDVDFTALVTKINGASPDFIYFGGMYTEAGLITKQAKEAGFEGPVMGGDGLYTQQYVDIAGAANAEGDFATSIGLPISEQPKGQEFQAMFAERFPNETIEAYDTYGYDATMVIVEAIKAVVADLGVSEITTAEAKRAIVDAVAATNMEGVTGTVSFDENGDTTNKAVTPYVVRDGAWIPYTN